MAKAKKRTVRRRSSTAPLHAGSKVAEGTVVELHADMALIGREPASPDEQPMDGETLIFVQGRRVFLPSGQAFIPVASLHRLLGTQAKGASLALVSEYHFEVFQDGGALWRWRIKSVNGRTVADSGEGYVSKANALRAVDDLNNTDWPIKVQGR